MTLRSHWTRSWVNAVRETSNGPDQRNAVRIYAAKPWRLWSVIVKHDVDECKHTFADQAVLKHFRRFANLAVTSIRTLVTSRLVFPIVTGFSRSLTTSIMTFDSRSHKLLHISSDVVDGCSDLGSLLNLITCYHCIRVRTVYAQTHY